MSDDTASDVDNQWIEVGQNLIEKNQEDRELTSDKPAIRLLS